MVDHRGFYDIFDDYLGLNTFVQCDNGPDYFAFPKSITKSSAFQKENHFEVMYEGRRNSLQEFRQNGTEAEFNERLKCGIDTRSQTSVCPVMKPPRCGVPSQSKGHVPGFQQSTYRNKICVFCKNNGQTLSVYGSHILKDTTGKVICPVLRQYVCPLCGATGDVAHTIRYCSKRDPRKSTNTLPHLTARAITSRSGL